jgi:hypothetical protein
MVKKLFPAFLIGMAMIAAGCGSSEETATLSVDERFEKAKALFAKEDYLDAIN